MKMLPYGRQDVSQEDIESVVSVLKSDWLTQGPVNPRFEQAVADYCGAKYGVATNSATSALHLACLVLELGSEDWLWTSPNTFVASSNCALYCGARVDFVDIDPATYNISVTALEEKLATAKKEGRLPKVLVAVHFAGQPCYMDRLQELSKQYGFFLIEDASHAIGGEYRQKKIGSCHYSDMTVFSFHAVKLMTTAEGGMVVTNDTQYAEKLSLLRSHGVTRNRELMDHKAEGDWYYEQQALGFNYRMTEMQAALGLSQLSRLDEFVARRYQLVDGYNEKLAQLPISLPWQHKDGKSAWHLYVIRLKLNELAKSRGEVFDALRGAGIGVNVHYIPVHTQPYYRALGFDWGDFPEAEHYYRETITLPLFPGMTEDDQDYVVSQLQEVLS